MDDLVFRKKIFVGEDFKMEMRWNFPIEEKKRVKSTNWSWKVQKKKCIPFY